MPPMDLLPKQLEAKLDPDKKRAMEEWYAWVDAKADQATKTIRSALAMELGHINNALINAMHVTIADALRAAGRHIATTKLCEPLKSAAPEPEDKAGP